MKQKYLLLLCLMILSAVLFFYFSNDLINSKIKLVGRYDKRIKVEQEKLNSAKVLNEQLQEVSKVIENSISEDDKFTSDEANAFIKRLADLADKYKIAVHSMVPKVITTLSRRYAEQLYTMELNCTFLQLGEFLSDLESFDHIIKVRTIDVRPLTDDKKTLYEGSQETHYKVTLELSTFKIVKEA
jgi:Tfp pilus assembly protein PilO